MSTSPRVDFAAALADAGGATLTVFAEEPTSPPALPALVIRPGAPYRSPSITPYCTETWRLEVVALVPIDAVLPFDDLDDLTDLVHGVTKATQFARWNGVKLRPAQYEIGGKSMRAVIAEVDIDV